MYLTLTPILVLLSIERSFVSPAEYQDINQECDVYSLTQNIDRFSLNSTVLRESPGRTETECLTNCRRNGSSCKSLYFDTSTGICYEYEELNYLAPHTLSESVLSGGPLVTRSLTPMSRKSDDTCGGNYCSDSDQCLELCGRTPVCLASQNSGCVNLEEFINIKHYWVSRHGDTRNEATIMKVNSYPKTSPNTAIRVILHMAVRGHQNEADACTRWFVTFNGVECSNPDRIEAISYSEGDIRVYTKSIDVDGVCYGIITDAVEIAINIGTCTGYAPSTSVSGHIISRTLLVMEVSTRPTGLPPCPAATSFNYKYLTWQQELERTVRSSSADKLIKSVTYEKMLDDSYIRVKYKAVTGIKISDNALQCGRWYITINGDKCQPISANAGVKVRGSGASENVKLFLRSMTLEAVCMNPVNAGTIDIKVMVGICNAVNVEDEVTALTGSLGSVSYMHLQEVRLDTSLDTYIDEDQNGKLVKGSIATITQIRPMSSNEESTDEYVRATVNYMKKFQDTGLRLTANAMHLLVKTGSYAVCMIWYFTIDNAECADPGGIDGVIHTNLVPRYVASMQVSGICNGIASGTHTITYARKECDGYEEKKDYQANTGSGTAFTIIFEELRLASSMTCTKGEPVICG